MRRWLLLSMGITMAVGCGGSDERDTEAPSSEDHLTAGLPLSFGREAEGRYVFNAEPGSTGRKAQLVLSNIRWQELTFKVKFSDQDDKNPLELSGDAKSSFGSGVFAAVSNAADRIPVPGAVEIVPFP